MSMLRSRALAGCLAGSLAACSSGPPLPVLPDGLHRVPINHASINHVSINRVPPVSDMPATTPVAAAPSVSPDAGDRS